MTPNYCLGGFPITLQFTSLLFKHTWLHIHPLCQNKKGLSPFFLAIRAFFFVLVKHENPFLIDTHFFTAIIGFWVLMVSYLLTPGRKKVNNNEIFW